MKLNTVKYRISLALFLPWLLCALFSGCGEPPVPSHENVLTRQEKLTRQLGTIFDSIKDKESAEAARPKLVAAQREANKIRELMRELGPPSDELKEQTRERRAKWEGESFDMMQRRSDATARYPELQSMIDSLAAELEKGKQGN